MHQTHTIATVRAGLCAPRRLAGRVERLCLPPIGAARGRQRTSREAAWMSGDGVAVCVCVCVCVRERVCVVVVVVVGSPVPPPRVFAATTNREAHSASQRGAPNPTPAHTHCARYHAEQVAHHFFLQDELGPLPLQHRRDVGCQVPLVCICQELRRAEDRPRVGRSVRARKRRRSCCHRLCALLSGRAGPARRPAPCGAPRGRAPPTQRARRPQGQARPSLCGTIVAAHQRGTVVSSKRVHARGEGSSPPLLSAFCGTQPCQAGPKR